MESSREKALLNNTLIITIGTVCTKLVTFFLLPLYTGILSTEEYGILDLLNVLVALLLPIVTFQVEQAIFRELINARENEKNIREIISNGVFSVILQCICFGVLFIIIFPIIKNEYKIYLAINVMTSIFSSLALQISRGLGENRKYSIGSFISASFTIIFNVIFLVVLKMRVRGLLLGTMIGQVVCIMYLFVSLRLSSYISVKLIEDKIIKKLWKYSIPLIPNAISWWVFGSSDRVIVTVFLGLPMNGILSAASKFSAMYITIYNIFNMSWTESIALHIDDKDANKYFSKVFNLIMKIFISFAVVLISTMPVLYPMMINNRYSYGYTVVPILILGSLFNVVVGLISVIYVGKKNTRAIANTSIISAILNIVIHIVLIKFIGLYAAAVSTLASYFIMAVYRYCDINKKYFKIELDLNMIGNSIVAIIIVIIAYYINNIYWNIFSTIFATIFAIYINKDIIKKMYSIMKNKIKRKTITKVNN